MSFMILRVKGERTDLVYYDIIRPWGESYADISG